MDTVDVSPESTSDNSTRIRYGRDYIFSFKETILSSDIDIFDHIDLNSVAQRANRGKSSKLPAFGRGHTDRTRESKSIVLGPQKRTWNTGCHVSQTGSRDAPEISGKPGRGGPDHRTGDRYFKSSNDYRREFRGIGRDRASHRRTENTFSGSHADDRRKDRKQSYYEEEPEWFSGGPTNVSETIELGGIVEADNECTRNQNVSSGTLENSTDSKASFESASPEQPKQDSCISIPNCSTHRDQHASNENQGSRFKHLFGDADNASTQKKENINEQLLRLLKGTVNSGTAEPDRNNVIQVENKLRSILLGRRPSSNDESVRDKQELRNEETKILTVEEIESQLSLPVFTAQSSSPTVGAEQPSMNKSSVPPEGLITQNQPSPPSNLASLLQSLALKQSTSVCTKANPIHPATLNTLGILSNPAMRLPSSTNAVSASARINQLHQAEPSNSPRLNDCQGVLGKILENGQTMVMQTPQHPPIQQMTPRATGLASFLSSEGDLRNCAPGFPSSMLNSPNALGFRRPIVKSQMGIPVDDGLHGDASLQKGGFDSRDLDRRLLNLVAGQHSRASGDKVSYGPVFTDSCNGSRMLNPLTSLMDTSASVISSNNNNNTFLQQASPYGRSESENNNFGFLSHLAEMDRSCGSVVSRNTLLPVTMKPKTLEEIERQEVFNTNTYF